jgi:hypothetical protein
MEKASLGFTERRNAIITRYKLGEDSGDHDWSGVVKDWNAYIDNKEVKDEDREKAAAELGNMQKRAVAALDTVLRRVKRKLDETGKEGAVKALEEQRARFAGTDAAERLEEELKALKS